MSRPRVLFVVPLPPPWAGVEQISRLLIDSSLNETFDLRVIKANIRSSNAQKGRWDIEGITKVLGICVRLFAQLVLFRPRLVYLTLSQNSAGLARDLAYIFICRLFRRSVVAHLHGSKLHVYLTSRRSALRAIFSWALSNLVIVVCAERIKQELAAILPATRIEVVYNAVPTEPAGADTRVPGRFTIGFMGHLSMAKGFYDMMRAAEVILPVFPHVYFRFAGERLDHERNVQSAIPRQRASWAWVETLLEKYPDRIFLDGIVTGSAKTDFFRSLNLFCLPSYAEAFPVAVLEAMSFGVPLVVTPVGALPEVLNDGRNALFIEPGNVGQMTDSFLRLVNKSEALKEMSNANRVDVQSFSSQRMANRMADVFNSVLANA